MSRHSIDVSRRRSEGYHVPREIGRLDRRIIKLETHMNSTMPHLATKKDLSDTEGRLDKKIETVRTEIQKEQKSARNLLLTIGGGIIATVLGTSFFGGKDTQVVYVPQPIPQQSTAPSVDTISALNELREIVMELKQVTATKTEPERPAVQPSN